MICSAVAGRRPIRSRSFGSFSVTATGSLTILQSVRITTFELPAGRVGVSYGATLTGADGKKPTRAQGIDELRVSLERFAVVLDRAGVISRALENGAKRIMHIVRCW